MFGLHVPGEFRVGPERPATARTDAIRHAVLNTGNNAFGRCQAQLGISEFSPQLILPGDFPFQSTLEAVALAFAFGDMTMAERTKDFHHNRVPIAVLPHLRVSQ